MVVLGLGSPDEDWEPAIALRAPWSLRALFAADSLRSPLPGHEKGGTYVPPFFYPLLDSFRTGC